MSTGAVIAMKIRKIISRFEQLGATSPQKAVSLGEIGEPMGFLMRRLIRRGVIVEVLQDRYWLDREKLAEYKTLQRKRVMVILLIILLGILISALLSW